MARGALLDGQAFPTGKETVALKYLLAAGAALVSLFGASLAAAWAPSVAIQRTLVGGHAFSEVSPAADGAGLIHAAIDIAASPKTVWMVINDCNLARRLVVTVVSCKIVDADPQRRWDVREQITKGNVFIPSVRNVVRSDYQPYSLIRFRRVAGDLKSEEGEMRLEALDGGSATRVIYVNRVAANIMAPAVLVRASMKRDAAKVMINLRRESLAAERDPPAP